MPWVHVWHKLSTGELKKNWTWNSEHLGLPRVHVWHKLSTGELKKKIEHGWTFNAEHIQKGETNSRIDNGRSDKIVFIIIIIIIFFIINNVNIIIIILIIREDKFSLCECACLEKKIFNGLHQIFYVQIVSGYYFANNVGGATIWTNIIWSTICWWFQRRRGKYEYFVFEP